MDIFLSALPLWNYSKIEEELFPLCTLITPNLCEASLLSRQTISTIKEMERAAIYLSHRYSTSILLKGGHLESDEMCDVLCCNPSSLETDMLSLACTRYAGPRIESHNLHGTGCTLSSAIATYLALDNKLEVAICQAKDYTSTAIDNGKGLQIGHGNGPLWHFPVSE